MSTENKVVPQPMSNSRDYKWTDKAIWSLASSLRECVYCRDILSGNEKIHCSSCKEKHQKPEDAADGMVVVCSNHKNIMPCTRIVCSTDDVKTERVPLASSRQPRAMQTMYL